MISALIRFADRTALLVVFPLQRRPDRGFVGPQSFHRRMDTCRVRVSRVSIEKRKCAVAFGATELTTKVGTKVAAVPFAVGTFDRLSIFRRLIFEGREYFRFIDAPSGQPAVHRMIKSIGVRSRR